MKAARRVLRAGRLGQALAGRTQARAAAASPICSKQNLGELALLDCLDAGKPITDCMTIDMPDTVHCFRWHAEAIDKEYEQVAPTGPDNVAHDRARTAGRGRRDPAVEFPDPDGGVEARPDPGHRQQRGGQARPADLAERPAPGGTRRRGRHSGRRAQRRARHGVGHRRRALQTPGRGRGGLHRLDRGGPPAPAILRRVEPQARRPGTRRQESAGRFATTPAISTTSRGRP